MPMNLHRLFTRIKQIPFIKRRRIKKKRLQVQAFEQKYYYALSEIYQRFLGEYSPCALYKLNEAQLDEILSLSQEELEDANEKARIAVFNRRKDKNKKQKQHYNGNTQILLINMDIVSIVDADLDRIKEEIIATQKAIENLDTVSFPENANDAMKEALIRIHQYSVEYQSMSKVLKAKLEYLKCAYEGLLLQMESDRLSMRKRAFDASSDF